MVDEPVSVLALALALGVGAQWAADRLRVPSIVLMLAAGLAVGPGLGWIDPDESFGELLNPVIALGVGLLLFEGGLSLRWADIGSTTRTVVVRLLSIGVAVTLVLASTTALLVTDLPRGVAVLFGSIMVVTGPTVVIPLLRQARLRPRVGRILRWEGIIVDPVGAVLAVSVLEVLLLEDGTVGAAAATLARTTLVGCAVGAAVAAALVVVLERHWAPDHLRGPLSLVAATGAFVLANEAGAEAGLYAATVAGVVLANQRRVPIAPIVELHEHLASLILAGIFVVLAARVDADALTDNLVPAAALVAVLVLVVRPAAVFASTVGTSLTRRERAYLAGLAPRGIVAASVSAVFGFELASHGLDGGEELAAITFLVVCGTTLLYGPLARPLARILRVDTPSPTGLVLVGSRPWSRQLAAAVGTLDVPVLIVAEDDERAEEAREAGLLVYAGSLEGDDLDTALEGVGARVGVVGSGAEALDAVGLERVVRRLGRANVWRVARDDEHHRELADGSTWDGRQAFAPITQEDLDTVLTDGARIEVLDAGVQPDEDDLPLVVVAVDGAPRIAEPHESIGAAERLVALRPPAREGR